VLARFGFSLSENDSVFPAQDVPVASGLTIILSRAKNITVTADGEDRSFVTHAPTVLHALSDARVSFLEDDIVTPIVPTPLSDGTEIVVVRVVISEETKKRSIDFETVVVFDDELGWRERKTTQKGKEGVREIVYELHSHDGKEVSRKVLSDVVVSDPVTEKVVQGTYVKVGKSHSGLGTWYAHTGTLAAASPWLPMGSYARVTNRTNGKSVIVKINDRGPFGKNRIIDLDRVAFEKIASIGAGVIDVKVEEIEN
ncbi:MAG: G5 domain-containing protein, partial [Candidatus Moranbacteria bacterium]|nr:G5 domain-containing protein [Candidatus Moranbacteria bacterium]